MSGQPASRDLMADLRASVEAAKARRTGEADELQELMAEIKRNRPGVRDASEDIAVVHAVLDALVARRRELGLTQKDVAKRMGVKQPAISQIETEMSDPRISTLQRYARALGARVAVTVRTTNRDVQSTTNCPEGA